MGAGNQQPQGGQQTPQQQGGPAPQWQQYAQRPPLDNPFGGKFGGETQQGGPPPQPPQWGQLGQPMQPGAQPHQWGQNAGHDWGQDRAAQHTQPMPAPMPLSQPGPPPMPPAPQTMQPEDMMQSAQEAYNHFQQVRPEDPRMQAMRGLQQFANKFRG